MQRLIAFLVMLAFAFATTAPAGACQPPKKCCCKPAPNSLCAPDCCDGAPKPSTTVEPSAQVVLDIFLQPAAMSFAHAPLVLDQPAPTALVGLHQRAAPRLPLRV